MNNLNPWDDAFRNSTVNYDNVNDAPLLNDTGSQISGTAQASGDSDMVELDTDRALHIPSERQGNNLLGRGAYGSLSQRSLAHLLGDDVESHDDQISFPDESSSPLSFDFERPFVPPQQKSLEKRTVEIDQKLFNKLMEKNIKHILKVQEEAQLWSEKLYNSEKGIEKAIHELYMSRNLIKAEHEKENELDNSLQERLDKLARAVEQLEEHIEGYKKSGEEPPAPPSPPEKGRGREPVLFSLPGGLTNLGNTCWMNAVLQTIAHSPSRYYEPLLQDTDMATVVADLRGSRQIDHVKLEACRHAFEVLSATLPIAHRYRVGDQFDPYEALSLLSSRYLPNTQTLPQPQRNMITFMSDGSSFSVSDTQELRLNANQRGLSMQQMLQHFFAVENLTQDNSQKQLVAKDTANAVVKTAAVQTYKVDEARLLLQTASQAITPEALLEKQKEIFLHETQGATKVEVLYRASRQLVLTTLSDQVQLVVNRNGQEAIEIIDVEEEIDLGPFLKRSETEQKKYRLDQVLCRSGRSVNTSSFGHCYAFVRTDEGWIEYNDSMVSKHSTFAAVKDQLNRSGYIFVYSKVV